MLLLSFKHQIFFFLINYSCASIKYIIQTFLPLESWTFLLKQPIYYALQVLYHDFNIKYFSMIIKLDKSIIQNVPIIFSNITQH